MPKLLSFLVVSSVLGLGSYLYLFSSFLGNTPLSYPEAAASTAPQATLENKTSKLLVSAVHGGTLVNREDALFELRVTPGALGTDYTFSVLWNANPAPVPSNLKLFSRTYNLKAADAAGKNVSDLGGRVAVCIIYDANSLGSVVKEALNVYRNDGKGWRILANKSLDPNNKRVCGDTTQFSDFGVFADVRVVTGAGTPNVGGN